MHKNIIIAGVGGQGALLASKIISLGACQENLFVRTSETIGMAQRGGSVSSHVRIGKRNVSPIVPLRHADILLGFELAEAARMVPRLSETAVGIVNTDQIIPTNVSLGKGVYLADEYLSILRQALPNGIFIQAGALAISAGDIRTLNIVMLGAACGAGLLPFDGVTMNRIMRKCVKPKLLAINEKAFSLGMAVTHGQNLNC